MTINREFFKVTDKIEEQIFKAEIVHVEADEAKLLATLAILDEDEMQIDTVVVPLPFKKFDEKSKEYHVDAQSHNRALDNLHYVFGVSAEHSIDLKTDEDSTDLPNFNNAVDELLDKADAGDLVEIFYLESQNEARPYPMTPFISFSKITSYDSKLLKKESDVVISHPVTDWDGIRFNVGFPFLRRGMASAKIEPEIVNFRASQMIIESEDLTKDDRNVSVRYEKSASALKDTLNNGEFSEARKARMEQSIKDLLAKERATVAEGLAEAFGIEDLDKAIEDGTQFKLRVSSVDSIDVKGEKTYFLKMVCEGIATEEDIAEYDAYLNEEFYAEIDNK